MKPTAPVLKFIQHWGETVGECKLVTIRYINRSSGIVVLSGRLVEGSDEGYRYTEVFVDFTVATKFKEYIGHQLVVDTEGQLDLYMHVS